MGYAIALLVVAALFVVLELKTSRPDGTLIQVHPYRRLMAFIMPTRSESIVFYDDYIDASNLLAFVASYKSSEVPVGVTHCVVAAANIGLSETPAMNRFVMGGRMYQRKGRQITFSMKRKKLDQEAKLGVVKMSMNDRESFEGFCARVDKAINHQRSGERTYADKEYSLFNALPRTVLRLAVPLLRFLDDRNILPNAFIEGDGMYTSMFIANLGSLGMSAGFHHLYEWGNCPLFLMAGAVQDRPVVVDGEVAVRKLLHLRYSYDERIDDGLTASFGMATVKRVLENPQEYLGAQPMLAHLRTDAEA